MILATTKTRILQFIDYKNIGVQSFLRATGIKRGFLDADKLNSAVSDTSIAMIIAAYPDLDIIWLLTGQGSMIVDKNTNPVKLDQRFDLYTDRNVSEQRIPLYDMEASAGIVSLFTNTSDQIAKDYIVLPDLPSCDGAIYVRGDSMYPVLKSGDIVLYKTIKDLTYGVLWGEMYIVSYVVDGEEYVVVKYVQKSDEKGHIRLVSHNTHHSPQDIPIDRVQALAIIKASVRYNTIR